MSNNGLFTALLLLALVSVGSAARMWNVEGTKLTDIWALLQRKEVNSKDRDEGPAIVTVVYDVPERLHEEFVDRWNKVEDEADDEKGLQIYDLKKSVEIGNRFYTYGEWDSMRDFVDHLRSDYAQDFAEFLNDEDILVDIAFLKSVTEEKSDEALRHSRRNAEDEDDDVYYITRYHVRPSVYDDFVDAWTDVAKDVWEEDGNINYSLRQYATTNHHWVVYGAWESLEDYKEHVGSDSYQRLHKFLADNEVTYETELLIKIGDEDEERDTK